MSLSVFVHVCVSVSVLQQIHVFVSVRVLLWGKIMWRGPFLFAHILEAPMHSLHSQRGVNGMGKI